MSLGSASAGDGSSADVLTDAFYPLYDRIFPENSDFVADIEGKLAEARMSETAELYLSRGLAIGTLAGLALWLVGLFLGYLLLRFGVVGTGVWIGMPVSGTVAEALNALKVPALVFGTGVVLGAVGFLAGFGTVLVIPYSRAGARKREINMLLPDAISFMYALSIGGLNQLEILEAMAKADDTYGEVSREFQSVVQETEYFDIDYRNAIRKRALETPSDELSQFFTDMLSIINSGGNMTRFLDDKKDKHMRTAKQEQELTLETLELFGEMYMTLSLFPLLLIIILVIMSMLGKAQEMLLYGTVYALIPLTGVGFLVLVSTVKQDEVGDGFLDSGDGGDRLETVSGAGLLHLGLVEEFVGEFSVFDRIKSQEGTHTTLELLKRPHVFFRDNPLYVLGITLPTSMVLVASAVWTGTVASSVEGLRANPTWTTFVYVYIPLYVNGVPLAVFREWNVRSRHKVIRKLSDDLRKLSSANDTGLTLLESVKNVAETSSGKLADEFDRIHAKVEYGMGMKAALIEFNNRYHIPRLARTVKLISKAQEASSQITAVLTTAAQTSENQDDIARERRSRARMQVVIIIMTYLTLLAVMAILKTQFLDVMANLSASAGGNGASGASMSSSGMSFGDGIDTETLSMLFFHAVTIQAILSGFISGYIRDADLLSGVKFSVALATTALGVWVVVG
ncbi:type IV pilus biogenesis complex membrane subunit [Haladaptatus paucihalophilus DX253]|uniref:Flagellar protein FlaJ n=1 Tax=Haladaptatus paucihalophilus DX253 TaxID=797209 RepID=E7QUI8_HALPU|nr:type II secretion system F family protein [Haladaptatus paucihalophilus]EFW91645.1 type IV pilus biogenesis complex membrane subunit [Haladaptatus paucihalophilus DX253]SHJ98210.1 flagellar protein FlaJ [Haladaptatus paucihalophilus DX253]